MNWLIPLFSPATGTWGGLTRIIAVAEAAQQAGHQVAFCASGSLEASLRKRGYRVYGTPASTFFGLPGPISHRIEARSQSASLPVKPGRDFGNIWLVLVMTGMAKGSYLKRLVEAERRAADDFHADALFTDLDLGGLLLSRIEGLPVAAAYQTPMGGGIGTLPWRLVGAAISSVLRAHGLPGEPAHTLCYGERVLKIIPSIPELEDVDSSRPDVRYVGSLIGDIQSGVNFQPEPGKRYTYAYLGTGSVPLGTLRAILPQVFPSGGSRCCLVGAQSIQTPERTGGVEFRPYVPAGAVLPHCEWTLCHGGQNTIIQSLLNGVPLLVFPGPIFERRFNARKVQAAGAGKMGEIPDFNPDWIEAAMDCQPAAAQQAHRLGEVIRSYGGARAAVAAMEVFFNHA
jgi:UDP:flavonoid glycosyltransferase YjiC (YdhE family)